MKIIKVCCDCGSSDVLQDAWAEWDFKTQEWVLRHVFNEAYCEVCDGPTKTQSFQIIDLEQQENHQ